MTNRIPLLINSAAVIIVFAYFLFAISAIQSGEPFCLSRHRQLNKIDLVNQALWQYDLKRNHMIRPANRLPYYYGSAPINYETIQTIIKKHPDCCDIIIPAKNMNSTSLILESLLNHHVMEVDVHIDDKRRDKFNNTFMIDACKQVSGEIR